MAGAEKATEAPAGFTAEPYPDLTREATVTLYVCTGCHPQFDTFERAVAEAHADSPAHLEGVARNDARKARHA